MAVEENGKNLEVNNPDNMIPLKSLIEVTDKFLTGEWTQEEFAEYGETMIIRSYMPLVEKIGVAMALVNEYMYSMSSTQETKLAELYRAMFFKGLLQGYALVDCTDENLITYENYDKLFPIFSPYLLSYCKDDYSIVCDLVKESISLYRADEFVDAASTISEDALRDATESNKKLIHDLQANEKVIENLKIIMESNDPATKGVVDELRKLANENSKKLREQIITN